jgi:hypothetical protein
MRVDVMPTHDIHSLFLRWIIHLEGKERARCEALGGPLSLEIEASCLIDVAGNRHESARVNVPIWPFPGPQNHGQARFWDGDSRRRFWVNLVGAVTTTAVDFLYDTKPGSVAKEGASIVVPERVTTTGDAQAPAPAPPLKPLVPVLSAPPAAAPASSRAP